MIEDLIRSAFLRDHAAIHKEYAVGDLPRKSHLMGYDHSSLSCLYKVLNQDCDRLQWGAGRIVHHVDLSKEVKSLQKKIAEGRNDVSEELAALRKMEEEQLVCFDDDIRYMTQAVDTLTAGLKKAKEVLDF